MVISKITAALLAVALCSMAAGSPAAGERVLPAAERLTVPPNDEGGSRYSYCEWRSYHTDELSFVMDLPDQWGDLAFASRFTNNDHGIFEIGSVRLLVHGPSVSGSPGIRVYVWSNNSGLPGAVLDSADIAFSELPAATTDWVYADFTDHPVPIPEFGSVHVGWTTIGGAPDTANVVIDDAGGPYETNEYSTTRLSDGSWSTMEDAWGAPHCFVMGISRCYPAHDPITLRVPSEYATIQEAIDAAQYGDTVLIADGVYTGAGNRDIELRGYPVIVTSENGPEQTIIDCQGTSSEHHRGFLSVLGEDSLCVIDGLTIRNGYADGGGAVYVYNSETRIRNCVFENNHADDGGAIRYHHTFLVWEEHEQVAATFVNVLEGCVFEKNSSPGGSGVSVDNLMNSSMMTIRSCTFFDNTGSAIKLTAAKSTLQNNIVAFTNVAPGIEVVQDTIVFRPLVECTNSYGNDWGNWPWGDYDSAADSSGNMSFDPNFCDTANGDLHIDSYSPCAAASVLNECGELIGALAPACQVCEDADNDAVCDNVDLCPGLTNVDQADADGDLVGDVCDNCPDVYNPGQSDQDGDGIGNACCCTLRGDADMSGTVNVADITFIAAYLFGLEGWKPSDCPEHMDFDSDGFVSLVDLTSMVNYLFKGGWGPDPC